jgi:hypothetical protein
VIGTIRSRGKDALYATGGFPQATTNGKIARTAISDGIFFVIVSAPF